MGPSGVCSLLKLQAVLWRARLLRAHRLCSAVKVSLGYVNGKWGIFAVLGQKYTKTASLSDFNHQLTLVGTLARSLDRKWVALGEMTVLKGIFLLPTSLLLELCARQPC